MLQGHKKVNQSAHRVITMTENFPEAPPPLTQLWWTGAHEMKASLRRGVGAHLQSATCSEQINKPQKEKKKKKNSKQKPEEGHERLRGPRLTDASEKKDVLVVPYAIH